MAPYQQRSTMTVIWRGDKLLPVEAGDGFPAFTIKPGENIVQRGQWLRLGAFSELCEHIGSGKLAVVCKPHVFPVGADPADVCLSCHVTRQEAADARPTHKPVPAPVATAEHGAGA